MLQRLCFQRREEGEGCRQIIALFPSLLFAALPPPTLPPKFLNAHPEVCAPSLAANPSPPIVQYAIVPAPAGYESVLTWVNVQEHTSTLLGGAIRSNHVVSHPCILSATVAELSNGYKSSHGTASPSQTGIKVSGRGFGLRVRHWISVVISCK